MRCEGLTLNPWMKHSSNVFLILLWAFATLSSWLRVIYFGGEKL